MNLFDLNDGIDCTSLSERCFHSTFSFLRICNILKVSNEETKNYLEKFLHEIDGYPMCNRAEYYKCCSFTQTSDIIWFRIDNENGNVELKFHYYGYKIDLMIQIEETKIHMSVGANSPQKKYRPESHISTWLIQDQNFDPYRDEPTNVHYISKKEMNNKKIEYKWSIIRSLSEEYIKVGFFINL